MPNTTNVTRADGAGVILQKYFTARTINATASSRAYANFNLRIGDILTLDPFNEANEPANTTNTASFDTRAGAALALPTANFLHLPAFAVVGLHPDCNNGVDPSRPLDLAGAASGTAINPRAGGPVDVVQLGVTMAFVASNAATIASNTVLQLVNGAVSGGLCERATLQAVGTGAWTVSNMQTAARDIATWKAINLHPFNTTNLTSPVLVRCSFGPVGLSM